MTLQYRCNALFTELSSHMVRWSRQSRVRQIPDLHRYRKVMGSSPVQAWIFFRLLFQLLKLKAHCEDHNFTHVYPQFTHMIFIYSYSYIFTIIGYMTHSQFDHLSMWLDSSVDRALHRYRKVIGSSPVQAWIFSGCFFNCLSWKHTARIIISLMFIRSSHIWFSYIHIHIYIF